MKKQLKKLMNNVYIRHAFFLVGMTAAIFTIQLNDSIQQVEATKGESTEQTAMYADDYYSYNFDVFKVENGEYLSYEEDGGKPGIDGLSFTDKDIVNNETIKNGDKVKATFDKNSNELINVEKVNG